MKIAAYLQVGHDQRAGDIEASHQARTPPFEGSQTGLAGTDNLHDSARDADLCTISVRSMLMWRGP
jgi:hypothetical protein